MRRCPVCEQVLSRRSSVCDQCGTMFVMDGGGRYVLPSCPLCAADLVVSHSDVPPTHCVRCGQPLLWDPDGTPLLGTPCPACDDFPLSVKIDAHYSLDGGRWVICNCRKCTKSLEWYGGRYIVLGSEDCPFCHAKIIAHDSQCPSCGKTMLLNDRGVPVREPCPKCGAVLSEAATQCGWCKTYVRWVLGALERDHGRCWQCGSTHFRELEAYTKGPSRLPDIAYVCKRCGAWQNRT